MSGTRAARWLGLAATPTFAVMALLTVVGGGHEAMICSPAPGGFALGGMAVMYLLMSAFHAPPWLKLIADRRDGAETAPSVNPDS
jgi:hypothetical protein